MKTWIEIKNEYKSLNKLKHSPDIYTTLDGASSSLKRYVKSCYCVVLGNVGHYLVVTFADAQRLQKSGY